MDGRILTVVDIVLKNGRIVTTNGIFEGGLAIESGKIVAMARNSALPQGGKTIDVNGDLVMPGFVDAHSHVGGMQRSDWEDFTSGTMAAAAGGVTTIIEMPTTLPPTSTAKAFREKREAAARQAVVNFALYGGAGSQNIAEIPRMAMDGAIGFKTFMFSPPSGREQDFWGLCVTDDGSFLEVLRTIARTGLISCVHAENSQIVEHLKRKLQSVGRNDLLAYLESRPEIVESEGISRAALLASNAGVRLHICHLSGAEAIGVVERVRGLGQLLTAETCPHYLTFTVDEVKDLGPYAKIEPPIGHGANRDALWQALRSGVIDIVVSDHGPHPRSAKEVGREDIWQASPGVPGLETIGPVMLTHMNKGLISLERLVKVLSENVARIFGLYPRKGTLSIGADADIIVVDPKRKKRLNRQEFYTKAKEAALLYDGFEVQGVPVLTLVNGMEVMRDGEVLGKMGTGQFVKPS